MINSPKVLYTILNVLILLVVMAIAFGVIVTGLSMSGITFDIVQFNDSKSFVDLSNAHYVFMGLNLILYVVFIYGLIKLRTVAKLFLNNFYYDPELGKNSGLSGKSFVLAGIFWWFIDGMSSIYFDHKYSIGVSEKTFIYLFIISIGLFLMLSSKLFDNALVLKNENDLTI